jgi:DNA-binding NarL/FixJ family response regulator
MRILIIEDEIIIARFIENQLKESFRADTCIALNLQEAEEHLKTFFPHLILCDIELNDQLDGIELMHKLKSSHNFELIFITSYQSKSMIDRASDLKPANYIIKPLDESRLYAGILPIIKQVENRLHIEEQLSLDSLLSPTEMQVLQFVAKRKTTKEIANLLFLSPLTIKNHRHGICKKLNLKEGNNALLMWALKNQDSISNG